MTIFQSVTADLAPEIAIYTNPELLDSLAEQTGANYKYALNDVILVGTWESINDAYVLLTDLKNEMQENLPKEKDAIESFDRVEIPCEATVDDEIILKQELKSEIETQSALFDCANCGQSFQESIELDEHTLVCHASKNSCLCPICSTPFSCKNSLHLHLKTFHCLSDQHINALNCPTETEADQSDQELELPHSENVQSESLMEESEDDTQFDDPEFDPETESSLKDSSKKRGRKRKNTQDKSQPTPVGSIRKRGRPRKNACEDSENSIPCEHCSKLFRDERKVSDHMKKDHQDKCLSCNGCEKLFINASLLAAHSKKCSNFLVVCTECNEEFTDRKLFKEHLRTVHDRKRFECEGCSQKFLTPHTLLLHIKNCSEDFHIQLPEDWDRGSDPQKPSVPCPHCQSSIAKDDLANHFRSTHVDKCKPCMKCDFLCLNSHDLTRHLLNFHDDDYTNCSICSVQFQNTAAWTEHHLSVHQNSNLFRCPYCDQYFSRFTMRANHMYDEHEIGVTGSSRHRAGKTGSRDTVRPSIGCKFCGKQYMQLASLNLHIRSEHEGERSNCPLCKKQFKCRGYVKLHLRQAHNFNVYPDTQPISQCGTCKKSFSFRNKLILHVQTEHDRKRLPLSICTTELKTGLDPYIKCLHGSESTGDFFGDTEFLFNQVDKTEEHTLKSQLQCTVCEQVFSNPKKLDAHLVFCVGNPFICFACNEEFNNKHSHRIHLKSCKRFKCKGCGIRFKEIISWKEHVKGCMVHFLISDYEETLLTKNSTKKLNKSTEEKECLYCQTVFDNSLLQTHIISSHSETCIPCKMCQQSCLNIHDLTRHMFNEHERIVNNCDICGHLFESENLLRQHQVSVHNLDFSVSCTYCELTFTNPNSCTTHFYENHYVENITEKPVRKRYSCEQCDKTFPFRYNLRSHIQIQHEGRVFSCLYCDRDFKRSSQLIKHKLLVHGINENAMKGIKCSGCKRQFADKDQLELHLPDCAANHVTVICQGCGMKFRDRKIYKNHSKSSHRIQKMPRFACSICNKQYGLRGNLMVHIRTAHTSEAHVCTICNRNYHRSNYLKLHMKLKHSEEAKQYSHVCTICGITCSNHFSLLSHEKSHKRTKYSDMSPLFKSCPVCQKQFCSSNVAARHIKLMHPNIRYQCPQCEDLFISILLVQHHLNDMHNTHSVLSKINVVCIEDSATFLPYTYKLQNIN